MAILTSCVSTRPSNTSILSSASRAIQRAKAIMAAVAQFKNWLVRSRLIVVLLVFAMSMCNVVMKSDFLYFVLCRR